MPKITFQTSTEFKKWLTDLSSIRKYSLYLTTQPPRIIAIPLVSTDPINYGIFESDDIKDLESLAKELSTLLSLPLYKAVTLEFADFKSR